MHVSRKKGLIPTHKLVLFLLIFLTFATSAYAGCCVGPNSCEPNTPASQETECNNLNGRFETEECSSFAICAPTYEALGACCTGSRQGFEAYDASFCGTDQTFIEYEEGDELRNVELLCSAVQGDAQFPPEDTDSDLVPEIDPVFGTSPVPNLLSGKVQPVTLLGDKSLKIQAATSEGTDITFTNAVGEFSFSDIPLGEYTVSIISSVFESDDQIVALTSQTPSIQVIFDIDFVQKKTFSGIVKDDNTGDTISEALIIAGLSFARTDPNGVFTLTNIDPQVTQVSVHQLGYESSTITINESQTQQEIRLTPRTCIFDAIPITLTASPVRGNKEIELTWVVKECSDLIAGFTILRCENNVFNCEGLDTLRYGIVDELDNTHRSFVDTQVAWNHSYTYKVEANIDNIIYRESFSVTTSPGDARCEGKEEADIFCDYTQIDTLGVSSIISCDQNNVLGNKSDCFEANNVRCVQSANDVSCESSTFCASDQGIFGIIDEPQVGNSCGPTASSCYSDVGTGPVNSCFVCHDLLTCSDLQSQGACQNTNTVCGTQLNCNWNETSVLGTGICVNTQKLDCSACNEAYGGCTATACDVISGCDFVNNDCVVDTSDAKCTNLPIAFKEQCAKDNEAPQTRLRVDSNLHVDDSSIAVIAVDSVEGQLVSINPTMPITTKYCVAVDTTDCQDTTLFETVTDAVIPVAVEQPPFNVHGAGTYTVHFFSTDFKGNVETTKQFEITVIEGGTQIELDSAIERLATATPTANLHVVATVDRFSSCIATCETCGDSELTNQTSKTHLFTFGGLSSGAYTTQVTCTDENLVTSSQTETFFVSLSGNIFEIDPHNVVEDSFTTLSVQTVGPFVCKLGRGSAITSFDDPNLVQMVRTQKKALYTHSTGSVQLGTEDGIYPFIVLCDTGNYIDAYSLEVARDEQLPQILFEDINGTDFDFSKRVTSKALVFKCADEPVGGFGCTPSVKFCIGEPGKDCVPSINFSDSGDSPLTLDSDARICAQSYEEEINGQGGRTSGVFCEDVRTDPFKPTLQLTQIPTTVNSNSMHIEGNIRIPVLRDANPTYTKTGSIYSRLLNSSVHSFILEGTLQNTNTRTEILFGGDRAVIIDPANNRVFFQTMRANGASQSGLSSEFEFGTQSNLSLVVKEGMVKFTLGDQSLKQTGLSIGTGPITIQSTQNKPIIAISLFDLERQLPATINIIIGDISVDAFITTGEFVKDISLTQVGLTHGRTFVSKVTASNAAGTDESASFNVVTDRRGPVIGTTMRIRSEGGLSFIPLSEDVLISKFSVQDELSNLSKIQLLIRERVYNFTDVQNGEQTLTFSSFGLPIGMFDIFVVAEDVLGNIREDVFPRQLTISNPLSQGIFAEEFSDTFTTNTNLPLVPLVVQPDVTCSLTYVDNEGLEHTQTTGLGDTSLQLEYPLRRAPDALTETLTKLTCEKEFTTLTVQLRIIIDTAKPRLDAYFESIAGHVLTDVDSFSKEIHIFQPPESTRIIVQSDEEVSCDFKFTPGAKGTLSDGALLKQHLTNYITLEDGNKGFADFTCTDAASNTGFYRLNFIVNTSFAPGDLLGQQDTVSPVVLNFEAPSGITQNQSVIIKGTINEAAIAAIFTNGRLEKYSPAVNSFEIPIYLHKGFNDVQVRFIDAGGNTVTRTFNITRRQQGIDATLFGFFAGDVYDQQLAIPFNIDTNDHELYSQLFNVTQARSTAIADLTINEKTLPLPDSALSRDFFETVFYSTFLFGSQDEDKYDGFAPSVAFAQVSFAPTIILDQPISRHVVRFDNITGSVADTYPITLLEIHLNGRLVDIKRLNDEFFVRPPYIIGKNELTITATNSLGRVAIYEQEVVYDPQPPVADVRLSPNIEETKALSPRPVFQITFDKPSRLIDAFIESEMEFLVTPSETEEFKTQLFIQAAQDLKDGEYIFKLQAEDLFGNIGDVQGFSFSVEEGVIQVSLTTPKFGVAQTSTFDLTVTTDRVANCSISSVNDVIENMPPFKQTDDLTHTIVLDFNQAPERQGQERFVKCSDSQGGSNEEAPLVLNLSYDPDIPSIRDLKLVNGQNNILSTFPLIARIQANTTVPSRCRFSIDPGQNFALMTPFEDFETFVDAPLTAIRGLTDDSQNTFTIQCQNEALKLTEKKSISIEVQTSLTPQITFVSPTPGGAFNFTEHKIIITTSKPAKLCQFRFNETLDFRSFTQITQGSTRFESDTRNLFPNREHTVYVRCNIGVIGAAVLNVESSFVIDLTPPVFIEIITPAQVTRNDEIDVEFIFEDNESRVAVYEYGVGNVPYPEDGWNTSGTGGTTSSDTTLDALDLQNKRQYYVSVRAMNRAGLFSGYETSNRVFVNIASNGGGSDDDDTIGINDTDVDPGRLPGRVPPIPGPPGPKLIVTPDPCPVGDIRCSTPRPLPLPLPDGDSRLSIIWWLFIFAFLLVGAGTGFYYYSTHQPQRPLGQPGAYQAMPGTQAGRRASQFQQARAVAPARRDTIEDRLKRILAKKIKEQGKSAPVVSGSKEVPTKISDVPVSATSTMPKGKGFRKHPEYDASNPFKYLKGIVKNETVSDKVYTGELKKIEEHDEK